VSLALGHAFEFAFIEVSKTDVFHCSSPHSGNQQRSLARWIVHPIVVAHRKNRQQTSLADREVNILAFQSFPIGGKA
jgi:hypothetical protein